MILSLILSYVFAANFSSGEVNKIEIKGKIVELILEAKDSGEITWASSDEGDWEVSKKDALLSFVTSSEKLLKLKITGPIKELSFYANKASLKSASWGESIYLRSLDADLILENFKGKLDLYTEKGRLLIKGFDGNAKIYASSAKTKIDDLKGALYLEQFAGLIDMQNIDANVEILSQKAKTIYNTSKGNLKYESNRGDLVLNDFSGSLRGHSKNGMNVLKPSEGAKVNWQADEGGLRLGVKKIDGAYIDVATQEGDLYLLPPLKAKSEGVWKAARAKLKGSKSASIRIRSTKADVRLKYE